MTGGILGAMRTTTIFVLGAALAGGCGNRPARPRKTPASRKMRRRSMPRRSRCARRPRAPASRSPRSRPSSAARCSRPRRPRIRGCSSSSSKAASGSSTTASSRGRRVSPRPRAPQSQAARCCPAASKAYSNSLVRPRLRTLPAQFYVTYTTCSEQPGQGRHRQTRFVDVLAELPRQRDRSNKADVTTGKDRAVDPRLRPEPQRRHGRAR